MSGQKVIRLLLYLIYQDTHKDLIGIQIVNYYYYELFDKLKIVSELIKRSARIHRFKSIITKTKIKAISY